MLPALRRRRIILILFSVPICLFLTFLLFPILVPTVQLLRSSLYYRMYPDESLYCYGHSRSSIWSSSDSILAEENAAVTASRLITLDDSDMDTDSERATLPDFEWHKPRSDGKGIFFFETSCASYKHGRIYITARQACAVESAAKMNPGMDIYLAYTAPGIVARKPSTSSDHHLHALLSYSNIHLLHLDFDTYLNHSPLYHLLHTSSKLPSSSHIQSHVSDILRYVTLARYGGLYLDLDVVVLKGLDVLEGTWSGAESEANVAAGVMRFGVDEKGKRLGRESLRELGERFEPTGWGDNGPGVITRLASKLCNAKIAAEMTHCRDITIYPPPFFYPIPWWNWTMYFDPDQLQKVFHLARDSYAIHVWNKHSASTTIELDGKPTAYSIFAKSFCPRVYATCDTYF